MTEPPDTPSDPAPELPLPPWPWHVLAAPLAVAAVVHLSILPLQSWPLALGAAGWFAAMLLRQAHEHLGTLETEDVSETILDSIFSRFCIGK